MNNIQIIKKIIYILDNKKIIFFSILTILRSLLEVLGIGLLVPIISIISDDSKFKNFLFKNNILFFEDTEKLFLIFVFIFLAAYFFKTIFLVFYNIYLAKYIHNLYADISKKILINYIDKGYKFFIKTNSAKIIRNISGEANLFAVGIVGSLISLISNSLLVLSIALLLIWYNLYSLGVIITIALISFIIVRFNNSKFQYWGEVRHKESEKMLKNLNEIIGSIKEILIYNKKNFFTKNFYYHLSNFSKASVFKDSFLTITTPLIEFIGVFIFFIFLIISFLILKIDFSEIIVTFGIFAFASIKLLPNTTQIVRAIQNLKFNIPAVKILPSQINNSKIKKDFSYESNEIHNIKIKNLKFSYLKNSKEVIKNINLNIDKKDKIAIVGESGSGKSTLLNILCGLLKPSSGKIIVNKNESLKIKSIQSVIGYVSQNIFISDDTAFFNISLSNKINKMNKEQIKKIAKSLKLNINLNKKVGDRGSKLSGGQIQRIGIARALYRNPQILILDEATNALDEKTEKEVLNYIFKEFKERIIIFCTHKTSIISNFNKVIKINKGNIKLKN